MTFDEWWTRLSKIRTPMKSRQSEKLTRSIAALAWDNAYYEGMKGLLCEVSKIRKEEHEETGP